MEVHAVRRHRPLPARRDQSSNERDLEAEDEVRGRHPRPAKPVSRDRKLARRLAPLADQLADIAGGQCLRRGNHSAPCGDAIQVCPNFRFVAPRLTHRVMRASVTQDVQRFARYWRKRPASTSVSSVSCVDQAKRGLRRCGTSGAPSRSRSWLANGTPFHRGCPRRKPWTRAERLR